MDRLLELRDALRQHLLAGRPDADWLAERIEVDPALAFLVLQVVNDQRPEDARRPFAATRQAVAAASAALLRHVIERGLSLPLPAPVLALAWQRQAVIAGLALRALSRRHPMGAPDELYTLGLLSRIARWVPEPEENTTEDASEAVRSVNLLNGAGMPWPLVEPLLHASNPRVAPFLPGSRPYILTRLMQASLVLADLLDPLGSPTVSDVDEALLLFGRLGYDRDDLKQVIDEVATAWAERRPFLWQDPGPIGSWQALVDGGARPDDPARAIRLSVLIVEDDEVARLYLETVLKQLPDVDVETAANGSEALQLIQELHPQVVITDWLMPVVDGAELCRTLRQSEWGHDTYVLMLTSQDGVNDLMEAFEAGVDDYISKPINPRVLLARLKAAARYVRLRDAWRTSHQQLRQSVTELARSNRNLQEAALLDELTGLPNRRAGHTRLSQAWSAARRYGSSLAVVFLDIDHFKGINDRLGHAAGDAVLQAVALVLRRQLRNEDTVCRWGGEEFLFVMPSVDERGVMIAAERIRAALENLPMQGDDMASLTITASLGCAVIDAELDDMDELLRRADQALYAAKRDGRNRVHCWAAQG